MIEPAIGIHAGWRIQIWLQPNSSPKHSIINQSEQEPNNAQMIKQALCDNEPCSLQLTNDEDQQLAVEMLMSPSNDPHLGENLIDIIT